jgi:hypothetical protein
MRLLYFTFTRRGVFQKEQQRICFSNSLRVVCVVFFRVFITGILLPFLLLALSDMAGNIQFVRTDGDPPAFLSSFTL